MDCSFDSLEKEQTTVHLTWTLGKERHNILHDFPCCLYPNPLEDLTWDNYFQ